MDYRVRPTVQVNDSVTIGDEMSVRGPAGIGEMSRLGTDVRHGADGKSALEESE